MIKFSIWEKKYQTRSLSHSWHQIYSVLIIDWVKHLGLILLLFLKESLNTTHKPILQGPIKLRCKPIGVSTTQPIPKSAICHKAFPLCNHYNDCLFSVAQEQKIGRLSLQNMSLWHSDNVKRWRFVWTKLNKSPLAPLLTA